MTAAPSSGRQRRRLPDSKSASSSGSCATVVNRMARGSSATAGDLAKEIKELQPRLFDRLPHTTIASLLRSATRKTLLPGSIVTHQDDPADRLFLLISGRARHFAITPRGQKSLLLWLSPGDIFGGAALLPEPANYLVGTEILAASSVLVWQRETIRAMVTTNATLFENGMSIACDYLVWYVATHMALRSRRASERLSSVILSLARGLGRRISGGLELRLSNEELAQSANVTTFTVSRMMTLWQRQGTLTKRRGSILLRAPEKLAGSI